MLVTTRDINRVLGREKPKIVKLVKLIARYGVPSPGYIYDLRYSATRPYDGGMGMFPNPNIRYRRIDSDHDAALLQIAKAFLKLL